MYKFVVFTVALILCSTAYCCSTFCLNDGQHVICGRNMDFHVDGGFILVCPKGITKVGLPPQSEPHSDLNHLKSIQWTSRYASLTFNLAVRELPSSGINEHGLVVNEMTLSETAYPAEDDRPVLVPLQWIQYQLDNCATVEEVLSTDKVVRVAGFEAGEDRGHHFLVCDKSGASVIVEFVNGERVVHQGKSLSCPVLTNNTYQDSTEYLTRHHRFGGDLPIQLGPASKNRFVCLADVLRRYELVRDDVDSVNYAFEALSHVAQGELTVWSIVYDATDQTVRYRTPSRPQIRTIDAKQLFKDVQNAQLVSIDNDGEGEITNHFVDYTTEQNLDYVTQFMVKLNNGEPLSEELILRMKQIATYPESFVPSK